MSGTQVVQPSDLKEGEGLGRDAEEPLIRLEADIGPEGRFGTRILEVTASRVRVWEPDGVVSFQVPLADLKSARNEPLVGGGRLEVTTKSGEIVPVLAYSMSLAAKFSEAARGIEQLARGEALLINLKQERMRCAKCDRLLPEKDGICPACVSRGATMLRIARFLRPYQNQAIMLSLLSVLTTVLNLAPPYIQGTLVDQVLTAHRNIGLLFGLMAAWARSWAPKMASATRCTRSGPGLAVASSRMLSISLLRRATGLMCPSGTLYLGFCTASMIWVLSCRRRVSAVRMSGRSPAARLE